jgi:TonB family protein
MPRPMSRQSSCRLALTSLLAVAACHRSPAKGNAAATTPAATTADSPPVAVNPVSPVEYPAALLAQRIEGRVLLRLYVDSTGTVVPDSNVVAESSGYPALDSAALAGARGLRFSPALHRGRPVALSFIQPILFRTPRARGTTP